MPNGDTMATSRSIPFMAVNRGILVASVYGAIGLVAILASVRLPGPSLAIAAVLGVAAGAIAGFSNVRADAGRRALQPDVTDALMAAIWVGIALAAANLLALRLNPRMVVEALAAFSAAALVGGAAGVPVLRVLSRLSIKGRRPFEFITRATAGISNEDTRFVVRVILQSVVLAALVALAATVIAIAIAIIVLLVVLWIVTEGDSRRQRVPAVQGRPEEPPRRALRIPKHGHVAEDGRVMEDGVLAGSPTGERVDAGGRVTQDGLLTATPTGMRIGEDGRVLREGLLTDTPTGVRLAPDGQGGTKVVKEGLLTDRDTGVRITKDGASQEQGLTGARDAGLEITRDGEVLSDGEKKP